MQGWWFLKDHSGELWAKRQFIIDLTPDTTPRPDALEHRNAWKWVGVDLGKGDINATTMDRGVLVDITRNDGKSVVYIDFQRAENVAKTAR